jgi:hypothetical protein
MFSIAIKLFTVEAWTIGNFMLFCFIVTVIDLITQEEDEEFSMVSAWKNGCL